MRHRITTIVAALKRYYGALTKHLRIWAGLGEGETLHWLMVALYSILGLTFIVLLLGLITGTPLDCIPTAGCERPRR